jgi:transcriptional regulator with XRE-family HTH domain
MLKMSQTDLGKALGLTYQQVQKYEKGTNRIGASRLQQISDVLEVPVSFFFEGISPSGAVKKREVPSLTYVSKFLASSEGLALAKAIMRINNPGLRRSFVRLAQEIAIDDD